MAWDLVKCYLRLALNLEPDVGNIFLKLELKFKTYPSYDEDFGFGLVFM